MFFVKLGQNEETLQKTSHGSSISNINPFGWAISEEKIFNVSANQKQGWAMAAMFLVRLE